MEESLYSKDFAHRLYTLRSEKGVTARAMSLDLGLSESFINGIENQKNFPTMENFFLICEFLGVTPREFFDYEAENPRETDEIYDRFKRLKANEREVIIKMMETMER